MFENGESLTRWMLSIIELLLIYLLAAVSLFSNLFLLETRNYYLNFHCFSINSFLTKVFVIVFSNFFLANYVNIYSELIFLSILKKLGERIAAIFNSLINR